MFRYGPQTRYRYPTLRYVPYAHQIYSGYPYTLPRSPLDVCNCQLLCARVECIEELWFGFVVYSVGWSCLLIVNINTTATLLLLCDGASSKRKGSQTQSHAGMIISSTEKCRRVSLLGFNIVFVSLPEIWWCFYYGRSQKKLKLQLVGFTSAGVVALVV